MMPGWLGKQSVPETREATVELLEALLANVRAGADPLTPPPAGIWVGFPKTPLGQLNASIAGLVFATDSELAAKGG